MSLNHDLTDKSYRLLSPNRREMDHTNCYQCSIQKSASLMLWGESTMAPSLLKGFKATSIMKQARTPRTVEQLASIRQLVSLVSRFIQTVEEEMLHSNQPKILMPS